MIDFASFMKCYHKGAEYRRRRDEMPNVMAVIKLEMAACSVAGPGFSG